jgi:hypothetical protein
VTCQALKALHENEKVGRVKVLPLNPLSDYCVVIKPQDTSDAVVSRESYDATMAVVTETLGEPEERGQLGVHSRLVFDNLPYVHQIFPEGIVQEGVWKPTAGGDLINPRRVTDADLDEAERLGKMELPKCDANVVHWFAAKLTECKVSGVPGRSIVKSFVRSLIFFIYFNHFYIG